MNNLGKEKLFRRKIREAGERIKQLEAENAELKKKRSVNKKEPEQEKLK